MIAVVFVFVVLVVSIAVVLGLMGRQGRRAIAIFRSVGQDFGLGFSQTGRVDGQLPSVRGTVDGVAVSAALRSEATSGAGGQPGRRVYTAYSSGFQGAPCKFKITPRRRLDAVTSKFKGNTVELGDVSLDSRVLAEAADELAFREYMSEDRRQAVRNLMFRFDEWTIDHSSIVAEGPGMTIDQATLSESLRLMSATASRMAVQKDKLG